MTHFLYAYRDDGADGQELKYSLRSLQKNWAGSLPFITIVGDLPTWAHDVQHLEHPHGSSESKVYNILTAVLKGARALTTLGVEDAIYCDDDYLLMEPTSAVVASHSEPWGIYAARRNRLWEEGIEWLVQAMGVTDRFLGASVNARSYELHRPMPIRPRSAVRLLEKFEDREPENCPLWRSMYGNLVGYPETGSWQAEDVRVRPTGQFRPGSAWASTDQKYWDKIGPKVESMFPNPSRWETS